MLHANIFCHICSHCFELFLADPASSAYCSDTSWTNTKLFIRNVLMDGMKAGISRHISSVCIQGSWHTDASCEKNGSASIIWKTSALFNRWPQTMWHLHSYLPGTLSRCVLNWAACLLDSARHLESVPEGGHTC